MCSYVGLRRRGIADLGRLDQSADPIRLLPRIQHAAHPLQNVRASFVTHDHRIDRLRAGGQLIDQRHIHVGVQRHGQSAWYGRGGEDELVRNAAFVAQRHALMHAEAMLFVDDGQGQVVKIDSLLEQRVGTNGNARTAVLNGVGDRAPLRRIQACR